MTKAHPLEVEFHPPSAEIGLRPEDVHLWRVWVTDVSVEHTCVLDCEEQNRADRFHFERDRFRFRAAHSALRHILSRYIEIPAHALRFSSGMYGKPTLPGNPVTFNMSHAGDIMLLSVANRREVGIDVEQLRDNLEIEMLLEQYFPAEDARQIRQLPSSERSIAFFQLWTRTEARLKAAGVGLAKELTVDNPERWELRNFTPAPGYAAAVAVEGNTFELTCWSWPN